MRVHRSCPTCEASCDLVMEVDLEARQVLSIKGDELDERSKGYVCAKSQAFSHIYEDPERLRRPVRKTKDGWQEISWEEALDEVGSRLRSIRETHGKDSIAYYYGNPNGHNFHTQMYTELFITMMDSERFFSAGSVDQQPKNLACEILYGNAWLIPVPDLDRADHLVCMGGNPLVSQGSLLGGPDAEGRFKALQQRGGKIVVLAPRRTETANVADEHVFIRPGTDTFFLLAWVNELFEREWVTLGRLTGLVDGVELVRELAAPYTPEAAVFEREVADLVMVGRRHIRDMNTWLHNIVNYARGKNRCRLLMHPDDVERFGLSDGENAEVATPVGSQVLPVVASEEMMPGVVSFPHGFGQVYPDSKQTMAQERLPGRSVNDLIDTTLDVPSGTSVVNGVPVKVPRVA